MDFIQKILSLQNDELLVKIAENLYSSRIITNMFGRQLKSFTKIVRRKGDAKPMEQPIEGWKAKGEQPKALEAKTMLTEAHVREVEREMGLRIGAISEVRTDIMKIMTASEATTKMPKQWRITVSPKQKELAETTGEGRIGWWDTDFTRWDEALKKNYMVITTGKEGL